MHIPEQYSGEVNNFIADIAILITVKIFFLSVTVQPVCVDWGLNFEEEFADAETERYVS